MFDFIITHFTSRESLFIFFITIMQKITNISAWSTRIDKLILLGVFTSNPPKIIFQYYENIEDFFKKNLYLPCVSYIRSIIYFGIINYNYLYN